MKPLILWDIDGTLLNCNQAGREALTRATTEVFGSTGHMASVDFQGKTDPLILHESLIAAGFDPLDVEQKTPILKDRYFFYLEEIIPVKRPVIMPGVRPLLELFSSRGIAMGLITGNFRTSAMIKLASHGLTGYFHDGAFGDDAFHRVDLPAVALARMGTAFGPEKTIIIGDTVGDIECARASGAFAVAVGTGFADPGLLLRRNPDLFFNDLSGYREAARSILALAEIREGDRVP